MFYAHRKFRNLLVSEVRVRLLTNEPVTIYLRNVTSLEEDFEYVNNPIMNPNKYRYFRQRYNPENISFEQTVVRLPTVLSQITELNDGA